MFAPGKFTYKFVPYLLSSGALVTLRSVLFGSSSASERRPFCIISNDWVANRIWKSIDEPKIILTLVRFDRKFLQGPGS